MRSSGWGTRRKDKYVEGVVEEKRFKLGMQGFLTHWVRLNQCSLSRSSC